METINLVEESMTDSNWQRWFEQSWAVREETLYPALFGSLGPGIYPLDADVFKTMNQTLIDPRWLTHGVHECPPTDQRSSWLYVSSGLSNAWESNTPNPDDWSGLGCEFLLQCSAQSRWALLFLRRMLAFQLLLACGRFEGRSLLRAWDRVPLRGAIDGSASSLNWALLTPFSAGIQQLPSGRFEFIQFVGITEDEADYARANGSDKLFHLLTERQAAPITNPERVSIFADTGRD